MARATNIFGQLGPRMKARAAVLLAAALVWPPGCKASGRAADAAGQPDGATQREHGGTIDAGYTRPSEEELRRRLTPLQLDVTQREGTEPPFHNAYWNHHERGIYVDVISGEPLFSSTDKYDSGTGWPSFTRPIEPGHLVTRTDRRLLLARTEVRSRLAGSHLGHVFDDGPPPTGLRYCMNSAALRFVPAVRLRAEGYGKYAHLFPADAGAGEPPGEGPPSGSGHDLRQQSPTGTDSKSRAESTEDE